MVGRVRQRTKQWSEWRPNEVKLGSTFWFVSGNWVKISDSVLKTGTVQWDETREHCIDRKNPGPPYRTGGRLSINKWTNGKLSIPPGSTYQNLNGRYRYEGSFICSAPNSWSDFGTGFGFIPDLQNPPEIGLTRATDSGAAGWNRARPGQPTSGLSQFIGEFKDVPRMLRSTSRFFSKNWRTMFGRRTPSSRDYTDQWLNTQFGWVPFLSDFRNFYQTTKNLEKQIQYLKNNNGKWVKRDCTVSRREEREQFSYSDVTSHAPTLNSYFYTQSAYKAVGHTKLFKVTNVHDWFEGRFRYYIPNIDTPEWRTRAIAELYGAKPNAALLWELTPWSWLIDWVSNVGDVISNMDNHLAENLAASYAYSMSTVNYTLELESRHKSDVFDHVDTWSQEFTSKGRDVASPFGFALTPDMFSWRQWSILGALGISRLF